MKTKMYVTPLSVMSIRASALSNNYKEVGEFGTPSPCVTLRIMNNSKLDILISYNGVDDNDFLGAGETLHLSEGSALNPGFRKGIKVFTKKAPKREKIYVTGYCQTKIYD